MNLFHNQFLSCWLMQESLLAAVTEREGVREWWIRAGIFPSLPRRLMRVLWEASSPLTDHSCSVLPGNHRKAAESCKTIFLCNHSVYPLIVNQSRNHFKPLALLLYCLSGGSQHLSQRESIYTQQKWVLCTWHELLRICHMQRSCQR